MKKKVVVAVILLSILGACASIFGLLVNKGNGNPTQTEGSSQSPNGIVGEQTALDKPSRDADAESGLLNISLSGKTISKNWDNLQYSFYKSEYIHPKIIEDMSGWLSDTGELVVTVNLLDANDSNRYYGEVKVENIENEPYPYVYFEGNDESFGYQYIGTSESGIHVLYTSNWGGGSGVFKKLMFFTFEEDEGIGEDHETSEVTKHVRINLKYLGYISLGDRYKGELQLKDGLLKIGKDEGWFSDRYETKERHIRLD